jgi:hypothetical protein
MLRRPSILLKEMTMKTLYAVVAATLLFIGFSTYADESADVGKAQTAARNWLALADGGKYAESWDEASSPFKAAVTKETWTHAIASARAPLGAVKGRKVKSATFARNLPGAPDGAYVVIQFETQFENKASAIETVTPMQEKDGTWRVSGYYIK